MSTYSFDTLWSLHPLNAIISIVYTMLPYENYSPCNSVSFAVYELGDFDQMTITIYINFRQTEQIRIYYFITQGTVILFTYVLITQLSGVVEAVSCRKICYTCNKKNKNNILFSVGVYLKLNHNS